MAVTVGDTKATVAAIERTLADPAILTEKVETNFKALDKDGSGFLDYAEAAQLVTDLCGLMHLPPPTPEEFTQHFQALDTDKNNQLSVNEVGSGIVAALQYKAGALKHFLAFAERDGLADTAELPHA